MKSRRIDYQPVNGSHYGFSAARIDDLGAAEYTLVGIAADTSGSVASFLGDIERCVRDAVVACRRSPRCDNLMLRVTAFDSSVDELHGFKPLGECSPDAYQGRLRSGGSTALYDAAHNAIESLCRYGQDLTKNDFAVNAIVFVVTDGMDNASKLDAPSVKRALEQAVRGEALESVVSILVGVNVQDPSVSQYLSDLRASAGFTQYVEIGQASSDALAKLADFVSRSISAQSQALGTGQASQTLTF
jgi:hypothetical protein